MEALLAAHAATGHRRERLLGQVLRNLGAPDLAIQRVLAWERRNSARIRWQLLSVEVIYRWILLHGCWNWWNNPWRDLCSSDDD